MIYEYALEPEIVATWGDKQNYRFFIRAFGLGHGRIVSRYPKAWAKKVWESFDGASQMNRKRLEEILIRLKETMVKRKECCWDDSIDGWLGNALVEHKRHPFRAILARNNLENLPEIIGEDELAAPQCAGWDAPHGITVNRKAPEMVAVIEMMLSCCCWVKFIDPYISKGKKGHKQSLSVFMEILGRERPVGPPETVEIHTSGDGATLVYLKDFYEEIIPTGLQVTLFQWRKRPGGPSLHNRYILTNLGGVSFNHGIDSGKDGENDDINRLDREQYILHDKEYDTSAPSFDQAADPLKIIGKHRENNKTMPKRVSPQGQK